MRALASARSRTIRYEQPTVPPLSPQEAERFWRELAEVLLPEGVPFDLQQYTGTDASGRGSSESRGSGTVSPSCSSQQTDRAGAQHCAQAPPPEVQLLMAQ
jgi:hypothetical protein